MEKSKNKITEDIGFFQIDKVIMIIIIDISIL